MLQHSQVFLEVLQEGVRHAAVGVCESMRVNEYNWANALTFPYVLADIECHIWTFF